ncbi:hypothetical protein [Reinekea sp.]|jgi:hypothetical protein|uniref:hypothetical protein n=1 Tax=Reinekea sp. TaxID=1970455 RepID=UPI003988CA18
MSFFGWVNTAVDKVTDSGEKAFDYVSDKAGDVKEYFVGDDEAVEQEKDAIPGTNGVTPSGSGINWTAAGVVVGALTLAAKFMK